VRALAAELRPHHAPAGGVGLDSSLDKDLAGHSPRTDSS
jgi:hypothetical protein